MTMDYQSLLAADKLTLIDFWADWCAPCKAMLPVLDAFATEVGARVNLVKINVEEHLDLAVHMKVMGVPTLIFLENGRELWRHPGTLNKEELHRALQAVESL